MSGQLKQSCRFIDVEQTHWRQLWTNGFDQNDLQMENSCGFVMVVFCQDKKLGISIAWALCMHKLGTRISVHKKCLSHVQIHCWKGDAAAPLQAVTWFHGGFMSKPCMDH